MNARDRLCERACRLAEARPVVCRAVALAPADRPVRGSTGRLPAPAVRNVDPCRRR